MPSNDNDDHNINEYRLEHCFSDRLLASRADRLGLALLFEGQCHSNIEGCELSLTVSSVMNSAQGRSVCCGSFSTNFQSSLAYECLGRLSIGKVRFPAGLSYELVGRGILQCELFAGSSSYRAGAG